MNLTINTYSYIAGVKTALSVNSGDLVVNGVASGTTGISYTTVVTNNTLAVISILKGGYYTYNITIDSVFTANKSIDIILVPILSIIDPNYNKPVPNFFFFQDNYSFKTYFYNGSSYPGNIEWYYNNTLYTTGEKGVIDSKIPLVYQLKIRGTTYEPLGTIRFDYVYATDTVGISGNSIAGTFFAIGSYLLLDLNKNITEIEYKPVFYITPSDPENIGQTDKGYARKEIVTINPYIAYNNTSQYTINYKVTDPLGIQIINTTISITSFSVNSIQFPLLILGNYTVLATLTDIDGNIKYYNTINVNTINFIDISYTSCNTFLFKNRSTTTDITFTVQSLTGPVISTTVLYKNNSTSIVVPSTNLYTVAVTYGNIVEYYIINNYCDLESCMTKYILDIFCDPTCDPCDKIGGELDLIRLFAISNTYFMKLHKEYYINNFYTALEQTKLDELTNIQQTLNQLIVLCKTTNCLDKTTDCGGNCGGSTKTGGCGCH